MPRHWIVFILLIAVISLSACSPGTELAAPTSSPVPDTVTPEPTNTPEPEIKIQEFIVFHDFNANEIYEKDYEYPIANIKVEAGEYSCTTDNDGVCSLVYFDDVQNIEVIAGNNNYIDFGFVFYRNNVYPMGYGFKPQWEKGEQVPLGLGQGPFTIPLNASSIGHYFDGQGNYGLERADGSHHYAVDVRIIGDGPQPVYAVVEGDIGEEGFGDCNNVTIYVRSVYGKFNINTGHLTEITVIPGQHVQKGDIIGYIDPSLFESNTNGQNEKGEIDYNGPDIMACTNNPHLHYGIYGPGGKEGENGWGWLNILELFAKTNEFYAMKE